MTTSFDNPPSLSPCLPRHRLRAAPGRAGAGPAGAGPSAHRPVEERSPRTSRSRPTARPARRQAFVSSRLMGPVVAIHVLAGARSDRGQTLLEIQPATEPRPAAQARGALAQAQAALPSPSATTASFAALHAEKPPPTSSSTWPACSWSSARGAVQQAEGAVQAAATWRPTRWSVRPSRPGWSTRMVEVGDLAAPGRPLVRSSRPAGREIHLVVRAGDIRSSPRPEPR